ncbi:GNAT family N-acetyltransferase [Companilactobacillus zhongbaensis]|uniref:GNAT family N-acetyltransferase n=1 Tax=Companilactobacillus zhongbaensis TaxID=2486009 RepID=UPI000F79B9D9|nr:GNAT family N-acetyltransferase [Companilactobacillus zhongbaensis]
MKIVEVTDRNDILLKKLLNVWESSVRATHLFLTDTEISEIKKYVPQALAEVPHLIVIEDDDQDAVAFMGIAGRHLEMLFVSDDQRGQGLGTALLQYSIDNYFVDDLAVNEQNPLAKSFYEHMGFEVYQRNPLDDQGKPYPVLYMSRKKAK